MFTSQARIDRKTGPDNLGRFEYLQALVTEFQDTDRQGNRLQNTRPTSNDRNFLLPRSRSDC